MKTKTVLTMLAAIALLAQLPILTLSQNNNSMPDAASFSQFSMPQNLGEPENSASIEQLPLFSPNGLSFYFASDRPSGFGSLDIYVSKRETLTSAWEAPKNLGVTVNTSFGESPTSISPDGLEMFINSQRPGGSGAADIWVMRRTDPNNNLGWSAPVNLGSVVNTASTEQNANYFVNPGNRSRHALFR